MKLLLVLLAVLLGAYLWRRGRRDSSAQSRSKTPRRAAPRAVEMASCRLCGLHLPEREALRGAQGLYCSADHKSKAEA